MFLGEGNKFNAYLGTNTLWPCQDEEDNANSDSKTINSDLDDEGPDPDLDSIEEFPDFDLDESETKTEIIPEDTEKVILKTGDSIQSALWINPNERDTEDLKK